MNFKKLFPSGFSHLLLLVLILLTVVSASSFATYSILSPQIVKTQENTLSYVTKSNIEPLVQAGKEMAVLGATDSDHPIAVIKSTDAKNGQINTSAGQVITFSASATGKDVQQIDIYIENADQSHTKGQLDHLDPANPFVWGCEISNIVANKWCHLNKVAGDVFNTSTYPFMRITGAWNVPGDLLYGIKSRKFYAVVVTNNLAKKPCSGDPLFNYSGSTYTRCDPSGQNTDYITINVAVPPYGEVLSSSAVIDKSFSFNHYKIDSYAGQTISLEAIVADDYASKATEANIYIEKADGSDAKAWGCPNEVVDKKWCVVAKSGVLVPQPDVDVKGNFLLPKTMPIGTYYAGMYGNGDIPCIGDPLFTYTATRQRCDVRFYQSDYITLNVQAPSSLPTPTVPPLSQCQQKGGFCRPVGDACKFLTKSTLSCNSTSASQCCLPFTGK